MLEKTANLSQQVSAPLEQGNQSRVVQRTEGMDVSADALLPPIIKLIQSTTKDAAKYGVGKFLRTDTGEVFDTLLVIPLVSRVTQTRWPEEFSRDAQPTCWSSNGITADPGAEFEGGKCHACPFFAPKPQKGKSKGMCQTGHNLILQDAESYTTYGMRLSPTGNKIMGLISSPSIAQRVVVKLYSEQETNATGQWYQLKVKIVRQLDEADKAMAIVTMRSYLKTNLGYAAPEPEQAVGGMDEGAATTTTRAPVANGFEVTVLGEPEMRYTAAGKAFVAAMGKTPEGYKKLIGWESLAEQFNVEVNKGDVLVVTGRYGIYTWSGRDGQTHKEEQLVLSNFSRLGFHESGVVPTGSLPAPASETDEYIDGLPF